MYEKRASTSNDTSRSSNNGVKPTDDKFDPLESIWNEFDRARAKIGGSTSTSSTVHNGKGKRKITASPESNSTSSSISHTTLPVKFQRYHREATARQYGQIRSFDFHRPTQEKFITPHSKPSTLKAQSNNMNPSPACFAPFVSSYSNSRLAASVDKPDRNDKISSHSIKKDPQNPISEPNTIREPIGAAIPTKTTTITSSSCSSSSTSISSDPSRNREERKRIDKKYIYSFVKKKLVQLQEIYIIPKDVYKDIGQKATHHLFHRWNKEYYYHENEVPKGFLEDLNNVMDQLSKRFGKLPK